MLFFVLFISLFYCFATIDCAKKPGLPELALPPLDPLFISRMELRENNGNFKFFFALNNATCLGIKEYAVRDLMLDTSISPRIIISFTVDFPNLIYSGNYEMGGQLLIIPVKGNGDFSLNFTQVVSTCKIKGSLVKRGKAEYLDVEDWTWKFKVGGGSSYFSNLFNGDKRLGDATNRLLNENFMEIFQTFRHLPEVGFGDLFKSYSNRLFKQYPWHELLG